MPEHSDNLILTGMMATGKSTVGRLVAAATGRAFVDLDERIAAAAGRSVAEIFAAEGEDGFRRRERDAVAELAGIGAQVVATGGWTVGDPENRALLESLGTLMCLSATPAELVRRLAAGAHERRPMLGADARDARFIELLDQRRLVYASIPRQVESTGVQPARVAELVIELVTALEGLTLRAVPVDDPIGDSRGAYSMLIGAGILDRAGTVLAARGLGGRRALIVSDRNVAPLYAARLQASLAQAGMDPSVSVMGDGEVAKSLDTVAALYEAFLAAGLDRGGLVVALGGGVVGDTAGFAAASYLRGVDLVVVPTSLLAMADAAIGGKTGVNLPQGKNLVGAFKNPRLVLADPSVLATLPAAVLVEGLGEVVKAAIVGDPALFNSLSSVGAPAVGDCAAWTDLIARAAAVKAAIVGEDPTEQGHRMWLNLGHTFAHALERAADYRVSHGNAVAVGLVASARLAVRLGLAERGLVGEIVGVLRGLGLPTGLGPDRGPRAPDALLRAMAVDKKRHAGGLRFVLPRAIGRVEVVAGVPEEAVRAVLDDLVAGVTVLDDLVAGVTDNPAAIDPI